MPSREGFHHTASDRYRFSERLFKWARARRRRKRITSKPQRRLSLMHGSMGSCRRGRSDVITSHWKVPSSRPTLFLPWHSTLIPHRYDGFQKAPDGTPTHGQRDRSLVALVAKYLGWARRCGLICSKWVADSGRTTRQPDLGYLSGRLDVERANCGRGVASNEITCL